jgi:hypothetical protein
MNDPSDAEFEEDCRALDTALGEMLEGDEAPDGGDPHEHLAAAESVRKFYLKHRGRLEADGVDVTAFLREFTGQEKVYAKTMEAEGKAVDAYLQARANQAEAAAQLTEYEFKILQYFESLSEADWAALPAEQQKEMQAVIDNLREAMPEFLASLPIEKRRQLEGLE